jgi:hypothetical protein
MGVFVEPEHESKRLNLGALEAALTQYIGRNVRTDEEQQERLTWFRDAVNRSPWLLATVLGFVKFLKLPLRDQVVEQFERELGRTVSHEELEENSVMAIAARFFFIGWDARGAVDEADQLKRITE